MSTKSKERTAEPTVVRCAVDALEPSPRNVRPAKDQELKELADSISESGIINPIIARPNPRRDDGNHVPAFEIVCGHRRWAAAKTAGLTSVPVIMQELDDEQADVVRITENLQRKDLHPLDEAHAFVELVRRSNLTAADVGVMVGKSATYVAQRMRLTDLPATAQKAMRAGTLALRSAIVLARVSSPAVRDAVTKEILRFGSMDPGEVYRHVQEATTRVLSEAPFDTKDATLVQAAGACGPCPKRSGNDLVLFPDVAGRDVCLDAACYREKCDAAWKRKAEAWSATGGSVLPGPESERVFSSGCLIEHGDGQKYVDLDARCYLDEKGRTFRRLLGKTAIQIVLARDPQSGKVFELAYRKEVAKALDDAGVKLKHQTSARAVSPQQKAADRAERIKGDAYREGVRRAIAAVVSKAETSDGESRQLWAVLLDATLHGGWHDTIADVIKRRGWYEKGQGHGLTAVIQKRAADLSAPGLLGLVVELAVTRGAEGYGGKLGGTLTAACQMFHVEPKKIIAAVLREKKAAIAKQSKKSKPKKEGRVS